MSERGSGRTSRQILDAPDTAVYVVHTLPMLRHAEFLIKKLRPQSNIKAVATWHARQVFRGTNREVILDHAVLEKSKNIGTDLLEEIHQHNIRIGKGLES